MNFGVSAEVGGSQEKTSSLSWSISNTSIRKIVASAKEGYYSYNVCVNTYKINLLLGETGMRKTVGFILICTMLLVGLLSITSCDNSDKNIKDFYSNADFIYVNTNFENLMEFNVKLFTKYKISNVSLVSIDGNNVDGLEVNLLNNTMDEIKQYKYCEFYTYSLGVSVSSQDSKEVVLNSMTIKINEEKTEKIVFQTPLKHLFSGGNQWYEEFMISFIPNDFSTNVVNSVSFLPYTFVAEEDVVIDKIFYNDFLEPEILNVFIDDKLTQEKQLPLRINKNQKVEIQLQIKSMDYGFNKIDYISTNLKFNYKIVKTDESRQVDIYIVADVLNLITNGRYDNFNTVIDKIIFEKD